MRVPETTTNMIRPLGAVLGSFLNFKILRRYILVLIELICAISQTYLKSKKIGKIVALLKTKLLIIFRPKL